MNRLVGYLIKHAASSERLYIVGTSFHDGPYHLVRYKTSNEMVRVGVFCEVIPTV